MIFQLFFWKFLKLSFVISSVLTFLFLIFQILRFDQIIFQLPPYESVPFLTLWFFYYFSLSLPLSIFLAYSLTLFELKEGKKLQIMSSFGLNPFKTYTKILPLLLPVLFSLSVTSFLLDEREIGNVRKQLVLKYYTLLITSVPPKTFSNFGDFTLYIEEREGGSLRGVFFKFQEGVVTARSAHLGEDSIVFEGGAVLTQRGGKVFTTNFQTYRLSLKKVMQEERRSPSRRILTGMVNSFSLIPLLFIAYLLVRRIEHHHRFYYSLAGVAILHQLLLFILRQKF